MVIIKTNNNHMVGINPKEVINSSRSTVVKEEEEATVKIPVTVADPPKANHISSKASSNRALLKVVMELHRAPHLYRNGRLQQRQMVKHTTTMKDRERRPGKSPQECHKGHRKVVKKRFPLPLDLFYEDRCLLFDLNLFCADFSSEPDRRCYKYWEWCMICSAMRFN